MAKGKRVYQESSNMSRPYSVDDIFRVLPVLSQYEKNEIWSHVRDGIYYVGNLKKKYYTRMNKQCFDNYEGYYKITLHDHILYRYKVLQILGKGVFGEVIRAFDYKKRRIVAIKITRIIPGNPSHVEGMVLQLLNDLFPKKKTILLQLYEQFIFRNHYCLVFELLKNNLYNELYLNRNRFSITRIQKIIHSSLRGLQCVHQADLLHSDLKLDNIVFRQYGKDEVKLVDFGACHTNSIYNIAREEFQALNYRAPEVILRLRYGKEIDIWSIGCVAAELMLGRPLFNGCDEILMVNAITKTIGLPPRKMLLSSRVAWKYFNYNGKLKRFGEYGQSDPSVCRPLRELFYHRKQKSFLKFLKQCLKWNPTKRITVEAALNHEWFKTPRDHYMR